MSEQKPREFWINTKPDVMEVTGVKVTSVPSDAIHVIEVTPKVLAVDDMCKALSAGLELISELGEKFPDAEEKFNGVWASYRDQFQEALAKAGKR